MSFSSYKFQISHKIVGEISSSIQTHFRHWFGIGSVVKTSKEKSNPRKYLEKVDFIFCSYFRLTIIDNRSWLALSTKQIILMWRVKMFFSHRLFHNWRAFYLEWSKLFFYHADEGKENKYQEISQIFLTIKWKIEDCYFMLLPHFPLSL